MCLNQPDMTVCEVQPTMVLKANSIIINVVDEVKNKEEK